MAITNPALDPRFPQYRDARRKMPQERHGELLTTAVRISAEEGLAAVTLRKVAQSAGVTAGLVSHYFSSAEQLINATFRYAALADLESAQAAVAAAATPIAQIRALLDYTFDPNSADAAALWVDASSLGRRNPSLAAEANAVDEEWIGFLTGIVAAGVDTGEFHVEDPATAARRLLTIIDGLGAQAAVQALPPEELKEIATSFATSELRISVD